ncbi:alpha/beta fold hydrolase [Streptomyces sp. WSLK1-3]|uniref:alpha/beta fold hydrolase n=1 Tax=Streptomyces sp. WSLK1-3 TaxID=3375475 RepID=UPI003789014A
MTIVFANGVPVTSAVWTPLINELPTSQQQETVLLSPPGFGAPLPSNFGATFLDYRDWLIEELSRFEAPVDIVRHDFGGGFALEVAMARPDLLRSWVTDTIGGYEPDFTWHEIAKLWQTPGDGERHVEEIFRETSRSGQRAWSTGAFPSRRPARWRSVRARRWAGPFSRCTGPCPRQC